jgi:hypothetical protein
MVLLVCLALVLGSGRPAQAKDANTRQPPGLARLSQPDASAAEEMGTAFARAITAGDADTVQSFIDVDAFAWSIANDPPPLAIGLDEDVNRVLGTLGARFASQMPGGTQARFRGLVERDGEKRALIRLIMGEQGSLNYIELRLGRRADGRIVTFDWFDYSQGRSAARGMRDGLATSIESLLTQEYGLDADPIDAENLAALSQLIFEALNGNHALALEGFAKLPREIQLKRAVLLSRHRSAMKSGQEAAVLASLSDLSRHFGDDPELQLIINDYWFMRSDRVGALRSLGRLLERLEGDAPLYELQAMVHRGEHEPEAARKSALAAIANDPDYMVSYWTLIDLDVERKDYAAVKGWIDTLQSRFEIELDPAEIAELPVFAGFVTSPEYAEWKRSVESRASSASDSAEESGAGE